MEHKFAIRKLVLQRILHSEIEAFDDLKEKTPNRFKDIGQSLAIFNTAVPSIIFSTYSFVLGALELWKNRYRLDALAFLHPLLFYLSRRLLVFIRTCISKDFKKSVKKFVPFFFSFIFFSSRKRQGAAIRVRFPSFPSFFFFPAIFFFRLFQANPFCRAVD